MAFVLVVSQVADPSGSAGMDRRSSQKITNIASEKTIPAMAAAFGVLSRARVSTPFSGIASNPHCFSTANGSKRKLDR